MRQEEILNFGLRLVPSADIAETGLRSSLQDLICGIEVLESGAEWITGEEVPCFDGFLDIASEQALNPESRISLGSEADRFGMRRAVLDWQISPIDRRTMRVAALRFGEVLAQQDIGRLKVEDWILSEELDLPGLEADEVGGHHHMCSTRMAATPREGVVDSNQKVFGIDNLYIAGSSVFSTAGHANPTLTIVQMSLRLAGHLETSSG
jgi:choline dehydrogenase-like flavoprotein